MISNKAKSAWVGPGWVKPLIRRFALLLWKITGDTGAVRLGCEAYLLNRGEAKPIDVDDIHSSSWEFMLADMAAFQKVHEEENPSDFVLWRVVVTKVDE